MYTHRHIYMFPFYWTNRTALRCDSPPEEIPVSIIQLCPQIRAPVFRTT